MKFSTKAIRVGQAPDRSTGAVIVPVYQTATFVFDEIGKHRGWEYTRSGNPTRAALEACIAALEEGKHGLSFGSGLAATDAVLSILRPGDHVVASDNIYGGTYRMFEAIYKPRGIGFTYVDARTPAKVRAAITPSTKLVWIETPTNPLLQLVDIAALAEVTRAAKVPLVVDNTFSSPYLQRPLTLGADVVVHSTTKYIAGHSDVIGGAVVTSHPDLHAAFAFHQNAAGAVPGPFDCWLSLRGLKTLALRMRQHCANAQAIAEHLVGHPLVEQVYYPGLPTHPQHELARRQMDGFGGMVTFRFAAALVGADGRAAANTFVKALRVFNFAESLGGVESLVCHPATMSHATMTPQEREAVGITEGTIRLSVGIEDAEDLIADLDQALEAVGAATGSDGRPLAARRGARL